MSTIRDVAKLAGVSASTASLAFRDRSRVSPDAQERIWKAAETLGYRPNPLAQSLRRGRSPVIGVLVGDISSPYFGRFLKIVEKRALDRGHLMIVCDTDADPDREMQLLEHLVDQKIGGILMSPHGTSPSYGDKLRALDTPLVMVDHKFVGLERDYVSSDSRLAAAMLTDHLLNLGHRRIAQITGPPSLYTAAERICGFRERMAVAGVPLDEGLIVNGRYREEEAYAVTMALMMRECAPTAILAANNMMALGALQALQELGIDCPGEVSLVAIDNVPGSAVIRPRLTVVEQDVEKIAQVALDYLVDRIEGRGEDTPRETILLPRMVLGTSTAPPPSS